MRFEHEPWRFDVPLVAGRNGNCHEPPHLAGTGLGLSVDWYRDVLRAKLVSLRLPRRLFLEYKKKLSARIEGLPSVVG